MTISMVINGHELYFEQFGPGDGPCVMLLHHGLGSINAWSRQVNDLTGAGFNVLAYDRWGCGKSERRDSLDAPGFAADLADLHALLEQLGIEQAAMVGHSDGGTIALRYASLHPERVWCLVTIAAHIYVEPKMNDSIAVVKQAFENNRGFREGMRIMHGAKYNSVFDNWYKGWYNPEHLNWDLHPQLNQISCPLLVVQGELDEHATPQHAIDLAGAVRGAELWILPAAGHMLPQENARVFNPKLVEFLRMHARGAANRLLDVHTEPGHVQ